MTPGARPFSPWIVVAAAGLGLFFGAFPIVVFSFSVFFDSFVREFHAGRGAVSAAFTIHNVASGVSAIFIGRLADRLGPRKVILPGLALLALMLFAASAIGSELWQLYVWYLVVGVVGPATTTVPYALVVSRWFDRRRGMAIGLMMGGFGTGAVAMPLVAQRLIAALGWRLAFAAVGSTVIAVALPLVAALLKEQSERIAATAEQSLDGLSWREASRSAAFWQMIGAFVLLAAAVHACVVHLPGLLVDRGVSRESAVTASALVGMAVLIGRIGCGYLLDRFFAPVIALLTCVVVTAGIGLLSLGGTTSAMIGAFGVGLGFGAEIDIMAFLFSRYFGLPTLGSTFGFAFGAFVLAGGVGPLLMGLAFDRTGSYRLAMGIFATATLLAAALISRLGPYRYGVRVPPLAQEVS
jgi:MFS family permease